MAGRWTAVAPLLIALAALPTDRPMAAESAVGVMYHRFGEAAYPSTSIRLQQFEAHVAELKSGRYAVLPLPEIVDALAAGRPLPDRAVAITVDDAYLSVFEEAWPRLKAAGLPFTLFVTTDPVDQGLAGFMSWDQIRALRDAGVTIGNHSTSHPRFPHLDKEAVRREIEQANGRFESELGGRPRLVAYPYGEAGLETIGLAAEMGFAAAFGQHSGVMDARRGLFYLPRFALNEQYGGIDRFRLALNALALPAVEMTPADPVLRGANPPSMGFTLETPVAGLSALACYASHEGRAAVQVLGDTRVEVRVEKPFPRGRARINCTLPAGQDRWYWLGRQMFVP